MTRATRQVAIVRVTGNASQRSTDCVAVEEGLEIRIQHGGRSESLSITMRTPGHDRELAVGFLFSERIIAAADDLVDVCQVQPNIVEVELAQAPELGLKQSARRFLTSSSCGVCGKSSLKALAVQPIYALERSRFKTDAATIHQLQEKSRITQRAFADTGGLHAATLFRDSGEWVSQHEDVGRHNAFDKVIGEALLKGLLPLKDCLILASGRASFELTQKAQMAGIPMLVAVGAPSSMAIQLARKADMTLIGFVRDQRFNIYHGEWRVLENLSKRNQGENETAPAP